MKKEKINQRLRELGSQLSPSKQERSIVEMIYRSINNLLGESNCIQIGSYPRYTAISPIHDLDVLFFLGDWDENHHDPNLVLQELQDKINEEYVNPTNQKVEVSLQTHSITIAFLGEEGFSVDIVPAYVFGENEFGDDTYKVPEIIKVNHEHRMQYYEGLKEYDKNMKWILTDPRGYQKIVLELDESTSGDFRKSVKIVKRWKDKLNVIKEDLKLKSFHLEQIISNMLLENNNYEIFDIIYNFFCILPDIIEKPNQIQDRADTSVYIDSYLSNLSKEDNVMIKEARDGFLRKLEEFRTTDNINILLEIDLYSRKSPDEMFLFDERIPVLDEEETEFIIDGFVRPKNGLRDGWLSKIDDKIAQRREIDFSIRKDGGIDTSFTKWKVRNGETCNYSQRRGEITDNQTLNQPEITKYEGTHYVECFVIENNVCIARSKIKVVI